MLALENADSIFDVSAPAGICSSVRDVAENDRLHGNPIPKILIEESLKNGQGRYGVRGCILVFEPDINVYKSIRNIVESNNKYGSLESMVGPDEYLITKHFVDRWHHIHSKYGWVSWADREELGIHPIFLHYVSQKPWEEGTNWKDFDYWKKEASKVIFNIPSSKSYFGIILGEICQIAGIDVSEEDLNKSKDMVEKCYKRKLAEKKRREQSAKKQGIDLTCGFHKSLNLSDMKKTGLSQGPNSARASFPPRSTPQNKNSPPNSARNTHAGLNGEVLYKPTPDVLIVYPNQRIADKELKEDIINVNNSKTYQNLNKNAKKENTEYNQNHDSKRDNYDDFNVEDKLKPSIPKLNLSNVKHINGISSAGPAITWNGSHWHKHHGYDTLDSQRSAADRDDDWRASSKNETKSARNWTPEISGISRSACKSHVVNGIKWDGNSNQKSSRADTASTWRSTPREESSYNSNIKGQMLKNTWKGGNNHNQKHVNKSKDHSKKNRFYQHNRTKSSPSFKVSYINGNKTVSTESYNTSVVIDIDEENSTLIN